MHNKQGDVKGLVFCFLSGPEESGCIHRVIYYFQALWTAGGCFFLFFFVKDRINEGTAVELIAYNRLFSVI